VATRPGGGLARRPDDVDLHHVAVESRDMLREAAAGRRIRVDVDVDPELSHVVADPVRLRQVVYNLLSNAIKFSRERGRVALRLQPEGSESFRIEVEDAGIGIAPDAVARLFDVRDGAGAAEPVSGVGLPATKRIVEQQGGRISVQSALGRGSVFSVVLPRRPRSAAPPGALPRPGGAEAPAAAASRRMLVVAEDASTRASLAWTFGSAGYEVISVAAPSEGLDVARERRCDVVAVDLLLVEGSAADFVGALRQEGASRGAPHVLCVVQIPDAGPSTLLVSDVVPRPTPADGLFAALERAGVPRGRERSILVLDGELEFLRSTGRILEVLGYRPVEEADSDRALRSCAEEAPAAVVLSPFPAGLDAFEFLRYLRSLPGLETLPVILTAPRTLDAAQATALRSAARTAARNGAGKPTELLGATARAPAAPAEVPST
jgi:CheY-like chemotaxis protein